MKARKVVKKELTSPLTMLYVLVAVPAAVIIHVAATAIAARAIGVKVLLVSIGIGPTLFEANGYRLGALPLGGYVRLRHTGEYIFPESELSTAIDYRSKIEQLSVTLSGCFGLFILVARGRRAWQARQRPLRRLGQAAARWPATATRFLLYLWLGILGSWLFAGSLYAIGGFVPFP